MYEDIQLCVLNRVVLRHVHWPHSTTLLQSILPAILLTIMHVVNASLSLGNFPASFKQAQVTPAYGTFT